jgi:serine protease inhibitor
VPPTCPPGLNLNDKQCEAPVSADCRFPARREGEKCVAAPILPPSAQLSVADALMVPGRDGFIAKSYMELLKDKYAAEVFEGATLADINAWVSKKTHDKIDKILDKLEPNSAAVLLNAVYFKAKWAFTRSLTKDEPFNLSRSEQVAVPTMLSAAITRWRRGRGIARYACLMRCMTSAW